MAIDKTNVTGAALYSYAQQLQGAADAFLKEREIEREIASGSLAVRRAMAEAQEPGKGDPVAAKSAGDKPAIAGYRELSHAEIGLINRVKDAAISIQALTDSLQAFPGIDKRWLSIGVTDLQKGFMAVTRSIAKPDGF